MRTRLAGRLLAGSVLAVIITAPLAARAAPDRVESVLPPPPMLNGHRAIRHREAVPIPPPPPSVQTSAPRPAASGFGIRDAPDRIMGANDAQIGEKLRAIVGSKQLDRRVDWVPDRKAVESFYATRNYAPIWMHDGAITERGKAAIARLQNAAAEGLDPADYPVPNFGIGAGAEALAEGDIQLTDSVLDFARHLAVGRIAPRRVVPQVEYGDHTPDPADILKTITQARDVNAAFNGYDPQEQDFRALKEKLAELRRQAGDDAGNRIADGPAIRPGAKDARIPALRARLHLKGRADDTRCDRALTNAIRRIQRDAKLRPTGIIDRKTLALINGPSRNQVIATVTANMERWRWLPRDLGQTYVMVNIPDFTLKLVHDHRVLWRTKIVAGKPSTPTPLVSAPMQQVIVNPSWYVPQSIIQNELLPAYQNDPNIFERLGLKVKKRPDGHINVVQPPGAANALGRIKFVFPNRFQVYLHDTPEKRLFSYDRRAFSHGCMRVEDPTKFGELMLSLAMSGRTPNSRQLYSMFGQAERDFKLVRQPMVHLTYQTAFVDASGKLKLRGDIYGFDARIHTMLHSDERRIADVAPPPDPKRDLATLRSNQEILRRVERREALNPFSFFERLFR
jgi:murein L,D-transpeptidase YcbB/YkuD